jgi:hypothetical protein
MMEHARSRLPVLAGLAREVISRRKARSFVVTHVLGTSVPYLEIINRIFPIEGWSQARACLNAASLLSALAAAPILKEKARAEEILPVVLLAALVIARVLFAGAQP